MTKSQRRMEKIVAAFQSYVATYTTQAHYRDYADNTFVRDMVYGIGIALDAQGFYGGSGFDQFKRELPRYLTDKTGAEQ